METGAWAWGECAMGVMFYSSAQKHAAQQVPSPLQGEG
jgi:hypothetical protein